MSRVLIKRVVESGREGREKKVVSEQLIIHGKSPLVREIVFYGDRR